MCARPCTSRYGDELAHSAVVGATHHDRMGAVPDSLPGPRPTFFFAPDRASKRSADWGREGSNSGSPMRGGPTSSGRAAGSRWSHERGPEALERAYLDLLDGRIDPARAHVLTLQPS